MCWTVIVPACDSLDMKNVTLKLDEAVLDRVRHVAIDEHMSLSAWLQTLITRELETRDLYEQNRKGALMVLREGLSLGGQPLAREDTHER